MELVTGSGIGRGRRRALPGQANWPLPFLSVNMISSDESRRSMSEEGGRKKGRGDSFGGDEAITHRIPHVIKLLSLQYCLRLLTDPGESFSVCSCKKGPPCHNWQVKALLN